MSTNSSKDFQKLFPESFDSPRAKAVIGESILYCSVPTLRGEIRSFPTSLEGMIEFSKKALGKEQLVVLTRKSTNGSEKELEIANVKPFPAEKVVSCHEIFFPFATYFRHLLSSSRLYVFDFVQPGAKTSVNKIFAIYHMNTSEWPAEHVAFKILKFFLGQGAACHWFSKIDLAWKRNRENKILN